jgi:2-polyprenyl-3-methyl-5-hydroxy-6-metoxy-1,4-benzoquinol methylase
MINTERIELCPMCGGAGHILQDSVSDPDHQINGKWDYRICEKPNCQTVWLEQRPLESELIKTYESYHTHTKSKKSFFEKPLLSISKRLLNIFYTPIWYSIGLNAESDKIRYMDSENTSGKLIDVGCGGGRFLARMKKRGWDVEGVDLDPKVVKKVSSKYGIKVREGDILNCNLAEATYDLVTLNQTIEHLYDPKKSLQECLRILKPGGKIVITTPNPISLAAGMFRNNWRGWEPPRHLYLFSPISISNLLNELGFKIEFIGTISCDSAGGYYISRLDGFLDGKKQITLLDKLSALFWSYKMELKEFKERKFNKNIGQGVFATATKPF